MQKNSVVRKSILAGLMDMLLPFYCRGCGKTGSLLCEDCRAGIGRGVAVQVELGELDALYGVGPREGALKSLVEDYKFKSVKKIAGVLAELLDEAIPKELSDVLIVPLPTVRKHIRERGFDHTLRLAEEFAKIRGLEILPVLKRINKTVQVGADEATRRRQAAEAYAVDESKFQKGQAYLLLDDVWTTGSSMRAAAEKLREAGAEKIFGLVVETSPE